jgi:hypothetical protein
MKLAKDACNNHNLPAQRPIMDGSSLGEKQGRRKFTF